MRRSILDKNSFLCYTINMQISSLTFNNSIFRKLLASYLLLTLIPVGLISFFSFKASEQIVNEQVSQSNNHTLIQIEKNIESLIDQMIAEVNIYNQNSELEPYLKTTDSGLVNHLKNIVFVETRMLKYSLTAPQLQQEAILIGKNGTVYTNPPGQIFITMENVSKYDWYQKMLHNPERIVWLNTHPSFFQSQKEPVFTAIKSLQGSFFNHSYGILILSVKESCLYDIYKETIDKGNQIFIMDSKGSVISNSFRGNQEPKVKSDKFLELIRNQRRDYQILSFKATKYLCSYKKIEKMDWYIISTIPLSILTKDIQSLKIKILLISLLCVTCLTVAAIAISRRISLPLIKLCNRVKSAHLSKSDILKESPLRDEISLLTTEYDNIIEELENTINHLINEQEQKRKAELHALQMQVNPHFLYNTLNSIKCLVWTGKTELIEPTINALIRLLEQTINKGSELIPIEEELNNIRNYLYIQEIRTGNPIAVQYRIESELTHYKIPKLLLQPIIENAIFHGIEPKNIKGNITIFISSIEEWIQIEIIDNGVGMDDATIKRLSTSGLKPTNRFNGIGVQNVAERLKLHFGQEYGVNIQSEIGIGTSVTLSLPKII